MAGRLWSGPLRQGLRDILKGGPQPILTILAHVEGIIRPEVAHRVFVGERAKHPDRVYPVELAEQVLYGKRRYVVSALSHIAQRVSGTGDAAMYALRTEPRAPRAEPPNRRVPIARTCPVCGKQYAHWRNQTCGRKCGSVVGGAKRHALSSAMNARTCLICAKPFEHHKNATCSVECGREYNAQRARARGLLEVPESPCPICATPFRRMRHRSTCSTACGRKQRAQVLRERSLPPPKPCPICATPFRHNKNATCSPRCGHEKRAREFAAEAAARAAALPPRPCPICRRPFTAPEKKRGCSVECSRQLAGLRRRGYRGEAA